VWSRRLEFDATKLGAAPIVSAERDRIIELSRRLDRLARQAAALDPEQVIAGEWRPSTLGKMLEEAAANQRAVRRELVALQEELDWTVYAAFGFVSASILSPLTEIEPLNSEHRPFAIRMARTLAEETGAAYWFAAMEVAPVGDIPGTYSGPTRRRLEQRLQILESDPILALLEAPEYKRKWEPMDHSKKLRDACFAWSSDWIERSLAARDGAVALPRLVAAVQDDERLLSVAGLYQGRRDVDLVALADEVFAAHSVPNHPYHLYTASGLTKARRGRTSGICRVAKT
jgi:hypothetical protein